MFAMSRRVAVVSLAATLAVGLAACGSDTVDNSADQSVKSSSGVPSVTVSSSAASGTAATTSSAAATASKSVDSSAGEPQADDEGRVVKNPQDSGVDKVDSIPTADARTGEDDDYLKELKDKGIDPAAVEPVEGTSAGDAARSLEDSLIAAGRSYCRAQDNDQQDALVPLTAGQLQAMGVVKGDPREAEKVIVDAARSAYCS